MSRLRPQCGLVAAAVGCRSALRNFVFTLGLVVGVAASAGAIGCGAVNGSSSSFPGTVTYESSGGEYAFNLLEPPWLPVLTSSEAVFVVPPHIFTLPDEQGALYSLHIYRQNTDAASAAQAELQTHTSAEMNKGPTSVASGTGSTGVEMSWNESATVYHRDAYINMGAGVSFRMHFSAAVPLADDNMISQMIGSFRSATAGSGTVGR